MKKPDVSQGCLDIMPDSWPPNPYKQETQGVCIASTSYPEASLVRPANLNFEGRHDIEKGAVDVELLVAELVCGHEILASLNFWSNDKVCTSVGQVAGGEFPNNCWAHNSTEGRSIMISWALRFWLRRVVSRR